MHDAPTPRTSSHAAATSSRAAGRGNSGVTSRTTGRGASRTGGHQPGDARTRRRERLLRLLTVAVSLLVVLAIIEVGLRLASPQVFPPHPPGMYSPDDEVGYVLTPGFEGEFDRAEFRVSVRVDASGLRGPGPRARKRNSVRILCLGDSFTWGWGANEQETYPAVLERLLQSRYPDRDVQVLNAGVPGYGSDEELQLLKKLGAAIQPDLVIVQFFAGNDFRDNLVPANRAFEIRDGMLYQVRYRGVQRRAAWLRAVDRLKQSSHLVHLLSNRIGYLAMRAGWLDRLEHASSEYFAEEDGRLAAALLAEMDRVAAQLGAETLFLFVPDKAQLLSRPRLPLRAAGVVEAAAAESGSAWIDLTPELLASDDFDDLFFVQDAHWTPKGHARVAGVLAGRIDALSLLPGAGVN